jgi:hypothetical protein
MLLDPAFLETADAEGFWLETTPDSDVGTVVPLDRMGQLGLERVFFLLAGSEGVVPVYAVRNESGRVVKLEIELTPGG